jgi:carbon dioxide concentrating mechanism protein CcmN
MLVSPLQLLSNSQIYVSGDVTVDEGAAIAPGVILQADPNSKIRIGAGTCIGLGTIIHARQGTLVIEEGVILGTGVLIVGAGKIGANACIGSGVTILNPAIKDSEMLAAGALIGDRSRRLTAVSEASDSVDRDQPSTVSEASESIIGDKNPQKPEKAMPQVSESTPPVVEPPPNRAKMTEEVSAPMKEERERSPETVHSPPTMFHGQAHINSLLTIMFPHRAYFKNDENGNAFGSSE